VGGKRRHKDSSSKLRFTEAQQDLVFLFLFNSLSNPQLLLVDITSENSIANGIYRFIELLFFFAFRIVKNQSRQSLPLPEEKKRATPPSLNKSGTQSPIKKTNH